MGEILKLVGFLKEYNNISEAITLEDRISESLVNLEINKILNYLEKGTFVLGWMGYFINYENDELIAPDSYFTDGFFVWPSYLQYYLKQYPNFKLEEEFISHLESMSYENKKIIGKRDLFIMENKLSKLLVELNNDNEERPLAR